MPTVRFEEIIFGGARTVEGLSLPVIFEVKACGNLTPTTSSSLLVGPITTDGVYVVTAIGGQVYAQAGVTPVAGAATGKWVASGGFAIFEMKAGDSIAVITANLT